MRLWNKRFARTACAWLAALMLASAGVRAQAPQAAQPTFKPEEIEALVAPIALYPDTLLSQVLMASTYPLEIVYAARWLKANPKVKGEAAIKAVESQPWDASVKSLLAFPQVLEPMNDKLDWTQKLGDAFLGQQKEVFAAVQRLRGKAQQTGSLKSSEQQKVIVEPATIHCAGVGRGRVRHACRVSGSSRGNRGEGSSASRCPTGRRRWSPRRFRLRHPGRGSRRASPTPCRRAPRRRRW